MTLVYHQLVQVCPSGVVWYWFLFRTDDISSGSSKGYNFFYNMYLGYQSLQRVSLFIVLPTLCVVCFTNMDILYYGYKIFYLGETSELDDLFPVK